jgi:glycosyltransferase involved in cell wall biosynthesis
MSAMLVMSSYGRFHFGQAADALAAERGEVVLHVADVFAKTTRARMVRNGALHMVGNAALRVCSPGWFERVLIDRFDAAVARWVVGRRREIKGVHGGALYCARTLEACKREGLPAIVERSGAHIDVQRELMASEYERLEMVPDVAAYSASEHCRARMLSEYETADRIVVSSTFVKETFMARGVPEAKFAVVPLGANYVLHPKRQPAKGPFVVLTVGNDFVRKGVVDVLEAWRLAGLPDGELRIRSPLPARWLREARALRNVTILPPMPHRELAGHFEEASVFCLLSIEDGFGMVVSEAMACGCPVVVSRNVGARDIVRDGQSGFVVGVRDPAEVAERLVRLYRDRDLLRHMSQAALETAGAYTWSRYARGLSTIWDGLEAGRVLPYRGVTPGVTPGCVG